MRHASRSRELVLGRYVLISLALVAVFWLLDSLMDVYVFDEGATLSETLLPAEPMETWMRSILAFLFIAFGFYAQHMINRRKRVEDALREGEEKWRSLMENSSDFILILDRDGTILSINHAAPGFTGDDAIGKSTYDFIDPKYHSVTRETIEEVFRTGLATSYETEGARPHGNLSWYETQVVPLKTEGRVAAVMQISTDITGRKRLEEDDDLFISAYGEHSQILSQFYLDLEAAKKALDESEERYRCVAETANDAIISSDDRGSVILWNRLAEETFGYSSEEMIGQPLSLIVPEPYRADFEQGFRMMVLAGGSDYGATPVETVGLRKDGTQVPVEMSVASWKAGEHIAFTAIVRDITERKQAEEETRLMALFAELNPAPVLRFDEKGRVLMANKAAHELLGGGLAPGVSLASVLPSVGGLDLAACIRDGAIISHPVDVADRHFLFVFKGVPDLRVGQIYGSDISERKQAEEALRESEQRLRTLFETMAEGVIAIAPDGQIVEANFAAERILGLKRSEIEARSYVAPDWEIIRPDGTPMPPEEMAGPRAMDEKRPVKDVVMGIKRPDDSVSWVNVSAAPLLDNAGELEGVVGTFADITERMEAERSLRDQEKHFRALIENSHDVTAILSGDGTVRYESPSIEHVLGYRPEELVGTDAFALIHPDDAQGAAETFGQLVQEPSQIVQAEARFHHKNGAWLNIEATGHNLLDDPAVRGIVVNFRDVTERKMAEAERQRIEQQVQLSGRLAAVGELAAGVAHELNNPLAAVQGFAELLTSRKDLDESMQSDVETIYKEAKRAAKITANLLSFSRKHEPEKSLISLNEVIETSLELHTYRLRVNNIEIETELDPALPMTMADFYQMQQICVNVVTNAEQAMTEAKGQGKISVRTVPADGFIRMEFSDDGPGIPEENLKRLFDPFFTTKGVGQGTGLGLSICFGIVEDHGGRIRAESTLGEGTTLIVEIPIVSADQATTEESASAPVDGHVQLAD